LVERLPAERAEVLASKAPLTKVDYQGGRSTAAIRQPNLNGGSQMKQSFGPQN